MPRLSAGRALRREVVRLFACYGRPRYGLNMPPRGASQTFFSSVDLAILQLRLPFLLDAAVRDWLLRSPILGTGLALPASAAGVAEPLWVVELFDPRRLVDEATLHTPGAQLSQRGLLAIAGCGRAGRDIFLVRADEASQDAGAMMRYDAAAGALAPLGITLRDLTERGLPLADTGLRRRLPGSVVNTRPVVATSRPRRAASRRPTAQERTLPLFRDAL